MKKNLLILALALLIALPVFGLAAEVTTAPVTDEVQATETAPLGGQNGWRRNQASPDATAPESTVPGTGYLDSDGDGVCDNCGREPGKNTEAPNYIDENNDGVCDRMGTSEQGQRQGQGQRQCRMQAMRDHMQRRMRDGQGMMGGGQGMMGGGQGKMGGQGMMGGQRGPSNDQGRNFQDENKDGVCDHFGPDAQPKFGPGSKRR